MKIRVDETAPIVIDRHGYTHRLEIIHSEKDQELWNRCQEIGIWLEANDIEYGYPSWGVFYLDSQSAAMFLMRWS
jgi:hypothetical protein